MDTPPSIIPAKDGVSLEGVDEEDIGYIRRDLLPLFLPDQDSTKPPLQG